MPSWILSILQAIAAPLLNVALSLLESKFPGIQDLINTILSYLGDHPQPPVAMKNLQTAVATFVPGAQHHPV